MIMTYIVFYVVITIRVRVLVFNATFNTLSVISWPLLLLLHRHYAYFQQNSILVFQQWTCR